MQTRNTDRLCLLLPRVVCLLSRFALPALALVAGVTTDVNATSMGDARVVQGRFASEADQTSFQATLSQVFGDEVKIANPGDSLVDGDGAAGDHFGISVALADDTAVVGAYADHTTAGNGAGSAYVLTRVGATWTIQAKLTAVGGQAFDNFGYSVALSGDTALVGAHRDSTVFGHTSGSAYVFTRVGTSWSQQAHLFAVDGATGNFFGYSVALLGDTALIGARLGDSPSSFDAGSAYVFTRSGVDWSQQAKLIASDGVANDNFGVSVALTNDTALVGADLADNLGGEDSGSAYVFTRTGDSWSEQMRLTAGEDRKSVV